MIYDGLDEVSGPALAVCEGVAADIYGKMLRFVALEREIVARTMVVEHGPHKECYRERCGACGGADGWNAAREEQQFILTLLKQE